MSKNHEAKGEDVGRNSGNSSDLKERTRTILSNFVAPDLSGPPAKGNDRSTTRDGAHVNTTDASGEFDKRSSPSELAKQGKFKDMTATSSDAFLEVSKVGDKSTPKISVEMKDLTKETSDKPHFVISKTGQIDMMGDPEALNAKDIRIQLDRSEGQLYPTDKQKESADKLVKYLSERIKEQNPDSTQSGVEVNDSNAVLPPESRRNPNLRQSQSADMTPETQESVGNMNRFKGTRGGEMPMGNTRDYFPKREVPQQPDESKRVVAVKEAAAGLFNPDKSAPYETVRKSPQGDCRVGRYGFSGRQIDSWLSGLNLGEPPDPAKIAELIKQGKLPKGFTADSVKKLQAMAGKLSSGETPNKEDMALMPKDLQESMATQMVGKLQSTLGDNPGAIAAGMMTGKPPTEVTKADLLTPSGRQLEEAGQRLFDIATARQQSTDDNDKIQWTQDGKVNIGNGKWLSGSAGEAFAAAQKAAAADGITIRVNSAGRTYEQQQYLYENRGTKGISRTVALPGTSNHEDGNALDIANYQQAKPYLQRFGFVHGDGRGPISNDLVHFKFTGKNSNRYA